MSANTRGLTSLSSFTYALPQISVAMIFNPIFVIQGVYVKYFDFPLGAMVVILLLARLFDALSDPLVGSISDWWKERTGKRKTFVAYGIVLFIIAGIFIYMPASKPSVLYLMFWMLIFYLGFTVYSIPHLAWGAELASDSESKGRIFAFHTAASYVGLALFYSLPLLPVFESSEITPDTMKFSMILATMIMIPALIICLWNTPEGEQVSYRHPASDTTSKLFSIRVARVIFSNQPFLIYMAAYSAAATGLIIWYSMIFMHVDIYLGAGELFSPLYLLSFIIGIFIAFSCARFASYVGNKKAWMSCAALGLAAVILTGQLKPGDNQNVLLALTLIGTTIAFVANSVLGRVILSEIIDYDLLRSSHNQGATYFAVWVFNEKLIISVAGALGLGLAAWFGFDPNAELQSKNGVFAINLVMSWLPAVFLSLSLILISLIPMNERRHLIIRNRLSKLQFRSAQTEYGNREEN